MFRLRVVCVCMYVALGHRCVEQELNRAAEIVPCIVPLGDDQLRIEHGRVNIWRCFEHTRLLQTKWAGSSQRHLSTWDHGNAVDPHKNVWRRHSLCPFGDDPQLNFMIVMKETSNVSFIVRLCYEGRRATTKQQWRCS